MYLARRAHFYLACVASSYLPDLRACIFLTERTVAPNNLRHLWLKTVFRFQSSNSSYSYASGKKLVLLKAKERS